MAERNSAVRPIAFFQFRMRQMVVDYHHIFSQLADLGADASEQTAADDRISSILAVVHSQYHSRHLSQIYNFGVDGYNC